VNSLKNLNLKHMITGERLLLLLAVIAMLVILAGYGLFAQGEILPEWQTRDKANAQLSSAQQKLIQVRKEREKAPDTLKQQLAAAQSTLNQAGQVFLNDAQAAAALNNLYQYASASGVKIFNLQALPAPPKGKGNYDVRTFRVQAEGGSANLIKFVTQIKEASAPGYVISNVGLADEKTRSVLTMDVAIYTSPYSSASGGGLAPVVTPTIQFMTPVPVAATPTPAATLTAEQQLAQQLDAAWAAQDWPQAIRLIEQIRALNPNAAGLVDKLYTAHVNQGQALEAAGKREEAKTEFLVALTIKQDGAEALAGLQRLAGAPVVPTVTPGPTALPTVYVVQAGDTLFSIARRYGVTVQAIQVANNLAGANIRVGQQLTIPR